MKKVILTWLILAGFTLHGPAFSQSQLNKFTDYIQVSGHIGVGPDLFEDGEWDKAQQFHAGAGVGFLGNHFYIGIQSGVGPYDVKKIYSDNNGDQELVDEFMELTPFIAFDLGFKIGLLVFGSGIGMEFGHEETLISPFIAVHLGSDLFLKPQVYFHGDQGFASVTLGIQTRFSNLGIDSF